MLLITRDEKDKLENLGLLKHKRTGFHQQDANFQVTNRKHFGRAKSYYVVEDIEILTVLGRFDLCNLQKITKEQLDQLMNAGLVTEDMIQHDGEYIPKPLAYISKDDEIYIPKVAKLLLFLGIWRNNKSKKN